MKNLSAHKWIGIQPSKKKKGRVFERFQKAHLKWVNAALTKAESRRETRWTEAIVVGDESFVGFVKRQMHDLAIGRCLRPS